MKKTPFYESGLAAGAEMIDLFGYWLPWKYSVGHSAEHIGTRTAASLCDLHYMGIFSIEGPNALAFIQKVMTNDYSQKAVGSVQYTAMCDNNGNMIDDGTVWRLGAKKYLFVSGNEQDIDWLRENSGKYQVEIRNCTEEHTTLALQGPESKSILSKLTPFDLEKIKYYRFVETQVAGVDCIVARMSYTGEFGYEIHFSPDHGKKMWVEIMTAGAGFGIVPCGQEALESLRQEAGYLLVGNDHDKKTNPFEAGIGFTVKLQKPQFIGKTSLHQIADKGVERQIVWLDVPSGLVSKKDDPVFVGDKKIGQVTSGSFSPTRKRGTAMAYVAPTHMIPGLQVSIESENARHEASLSVMPLYDPGNWRNKTTSIPKSGSRSVVFPAEKSNKKRTERVLAAK